MADHSKKAYALVDSSTIDRKMYDVAADPSQGPKDTTFQGVFSTENKADHEKLAARLAVLNHLGDYAAALQKLATADFRKDIDEASKDLNGALVGLAQTYKAVKGQDAPVKEEQLQMIATAVDAIGTAIVERKRRAAIKTIIKESDNAVQTAAQLLKTELGEGTELAKFVSENLANVGGSVRTAYNHQRTKPDSTFATRYEMLGQIRHFYEAAQASPDFFKNVSAGAAKLAESHAALKKAVTENKFTSAEIIKQVGGLAEYAKSVKGFYEGLSSKDKK